MRDTLLFAILSVLVPLSVAHPWIGVLVWNWVGLMNPHKLTYGPAYNFPIAQVVAIATLTGLLFAKDRRPFLWTREMVLIALLFAYFTLTTFFAWAPESAWELWAKVGKILLMVFVVPLVIYGPKRIRWLLLVVALSVGVYGIKGGIFTLMTGGSHTVLGPRGSTFISSNTYIGLAFLMVAPVLVMLARTETRRWLRVFLYATAALNFLCIPFTYSRGALVGLLVVLPLLFLRSRTKFLLILLAIPLIYFGESMIPERLIKRTQTLETYEQDQSARLRFQSWGANFNIAKEQPFIGGGFNLEHASDAKWLSYAPFLVGDGTFEAGNYARAAHSAYFQVLGSHGFIALGMFVLLLALMLARLQGLKTRAAKRQGGEAISAYASGIQLAMIGFCVSGAFINAAYFDLFFLYGAMTAVLWRDYRQLAEMTKPAAHRAALSLGGASPATASRAAAHDVSV